ncbi:MAG: hypothetical protein KDA24_19140 [Deltaproteobacteria bacterium]|nr:hypothetical protein [Deltaproteobacteria bacterium]
MRALALLFLLLVPSLAVADESVTFHWTPPQGGAVVTEAESMTMSFGLDLFVGEAAFGSMKASNVNRESVVATLGPPWSAAKKKGSLAYGNTGTIETQTKPDGTSETSEELPVVAGKTYTITQKKTGTPKVVNDSGEDLSEEELATVLEDWTELAATEPGGLEGALVDKTFSVGDDMSAEAQVLANLFGEDDELSVTNPKVTFSEIRTVKGERCAVLALSMLMIGRETELTMSMAVAGEAVISIDTLRPHSIRIEGPMSLAAAMIEEGMTVRMAGGGTFVMDMSFTYE